MRHLSGGQFSARSESGATSTEYLFLVVLIALVLLAGVQLYGGALKEKFDGAANDVVNAG